jgi:hypothetical protein
MIAGVLVAFAVEPSRGTHLRRLSGPSECDDGAALGVARARRTGAAHQRNQACRLRGGLHAGAVLRWRDLATVQIKYDQVAETKGTRLHN